MSATSNHGQSIWSAYSNVFRKILKGQKPVREDFSFRFSSERLTIGDTKKVSVERLRVRSIRLLLMVAVGALMPISAKVSEYLPSVLLFVFVVIMFAPIPGRKESNVSGS